METAPPNPFEPPRTSDLDGNPPAGTGPVLIPDDALDELSGAAPWARRLSRVVAVSIAIQLFGLLALYRRYWFAFTAKTALIAAVGIAITALFMVVLRRYAAASERFRDGDDDAIGPLLATQALFFKLAGVVALVGTTAFVGWLAMGVASGRWLAWMHQ